jgi:hypothetical protein
MIAVDKTPPAGARASAERAADLVSAALRLDAWIEREDFQGWDPHDALNSPLIKRLTFGSRPLGIGWIQLVKRSPVNPRRWLRVVKGHNPKGMGLFLASYVRKYQARKDPDDLARIQRLATWLHANASDGYAGACWGYNFDWANRNFFAPAGTPTLVNTAFNGLALLDCSTVAWPPDLSPIGERARLDARSACDFILQSLWSDRPAPDELRFSYTPLDRHTVHNANVLGASLLASVFSRTGEPKLAEAALAAARYTARRQRSDGSWPYSESPRSAWIDNFHTGYVLVALARVGACLQTAELDDTIARGYAFWKREMFLPDGTPRYYAGRTYPIDTHCVAQAMLTFLAMNDVDPEAKALAIRVARWGISHLQDAAGYFHYQIHRGYRIRIPYMRWTQAWMQRALAELLWSTER